MIVEPAHYTYETMPDYCDEVEGAHELQVTREELEVRYLPDVVYDTRDGAPLRLQILQPRTSGNPKQLFPCVLFVQGSHWAKQDVYRNVANLGALARRGFVCAIVEYRHYGIARFPAQVVDAKNAVRFVREHASDYFVDPEKIVIMGDSSGGHVAALAGMTALTGTLDDPLNSQSCGVCGIIDLYGAVDPTLPYGFPTTLDHQLPTSPEGTLMGFNIREEPERAQAAVVKNYVKEHFGPVLILHGTKDRIVFCQQSVDLYRALRAVGKDVELYLIRGSDHADAGFWADVTLDIYERFVRRCVAPAADR